VGNLIIHSAANTRYHVTDPQGQDTPSGAKLDSGALLIEFKPSKDQRRFQILTPHAIAGVRGTTWAVDVGAERTSTWSSGLSR
jgi:hypothetical protein